MKTLLTFILSIFILTSIHAQNITVSGIVKEENGPLPGATIKVKESSKEVTTDFDGHYEIETQVGKTLVFSYVGYKTKEIRITDTPIVNVELENDMLLDEVIIVAAGIKREKKALGYAVSEVSSESIETSEARGHTYKGDTPAAGQLTAGEINDLVKWKSWNKVCNLKETTSILNKWRFSFENKLKVIVKDSEGNLVNNAKVRLYVNQKPIMTGRTDVNGEVMVFKGSIDKKSRLLVQVLSNGRIYGRPIRNYQNEATLIVAPVYISNDLDIMFTIDATGSMGDEINYLKSELGNIISRVDKSIEEKRVALTFYRDSGDEYEVRDFDFESTITTVKSNLDAQHASGGGDFEEAVEKALKVSLAQSWNDNAKSRLLFLLLDAPPHFNPEIVTTIKQQIAIAQEKGIKIIPIVASGADKDVEFLMRSFSIATNGTYVFLTDDSGIGNPHLKPSTTNFKVEKLNDLIVRLIEKYAGTKTEV